MDSKSETLTRFTKSLANAISQQYGGENSEQLPYADAEMSTLSSPAKCYI